MPAPVGASRFVIRATHERGVGVPPSRSLSTASHEALFSLCRAARDLGRCASWFSSSSKTPCSRYSWSHHLLETFGAGWTVATYRNGFWTAPGGTCPTIGGITAGGEVPQIPLARDQSWCGELETNWPTIQLAASMLMRGVAVTAEAVQTLRADARSKSI
jgi:hypothetical protein